MVFTVWVGGVEVNDNYLATVKEAEELAKVYKDKGYDDVEIEGVDMEREILEKMALCVVSVDNYYDLADTVQDTPDEDLEYIVACKGNVECEDKWNERKE